VARDLEEIEFLPSHPEGVTDAMVRLAAAGDGWINLMPGVDGDDIDEPSVQTPLTALLGSTQAPVTMCTWVPAKGGRRARDEVALGIMHPRGRFAISQLRELGIALPEGWRVRQDHARRGLIVLVPRAVPNGIVLDWALRAGAALATVPLTGSWKARIFLPASS